MDTQVLLMHLLSGLSLSGAGSLNRFVAVDTPMSWVKAGQYCRKNYVDLVTVRNAEDLQQLNSLKSNATGWIGLSDRRFSWLAINEDTNSWKWSFTYTSTYHHFKSGEPDFKNENEACVRMELDGHWTDQPCSSLNDFLCLTGSPTNKDYFLVTLKMTWEDARDHCRFWFIDLAVISSDQENAHAKSKFYFLLLQLSSSVWIGLHREPWGWKDGSLSEFRPWAPGEPHTSGGQAVCVRLVLDGFFCDDCKDEYPFFCTRALKQTVLRIEIQSDLDVTDPNVQDNLLQQFTASLTNAGKTDFHLSWSGPPRRASGPAPSTAEEEAGGPSSSAPESAALGSSSDPETTELTESKGNGKGRG